jgi:hypothetical protein
MQSNFYIPQYQHLTKEAAMDIMEINTIGLRLFTSYLPFKTEFSSLYKRTNLVRCSCSVIK